MTALRIVLADDNLLVRAGLESLFHDLPEVDVTAACGSLPELLEAVETHRPDAVVTDIRMPPTLTDEGVRAAMTLRSTHPECGVVVLSQFVDASLALQLVSDGSHRRGYLLKDRVGNVDELLRALRTVAEGGSYIDPTVVDALMAARSRRDASALNRLTDREREVLAAIAGGASNRAIAERLYVSDRAIEKHINAIFSKLDLGASPELNRRVSAVLMFLQNGH